MRCGGAIRRRSVRASIAAALGAAVAGCGGSGGGGNPGLPGSPTTVVIDVPSVEVSGQFRLNGQAFPTTPLDAAQFRVRDPGGGTALLGATQDGPFTRRLVSGFYDVVYAATAPGATAPLNPEIVVRPAADLTTDTTMDPNVFSVVVTPFFTWNGGAFPPTPLDYGEFWLVPVAGGAAVKIGRSDQAPVAVNVVPGVYDVEWRYVTGPTVPRNERAVILPGVNVPGNLLLPVNVVSVVCAVTPFLDGGPFPVLPAEQGRLLLRRPGFPDRVDLGTTNGGPVLAQSVVSGAYDVVYTHESGVVVPRNEDAVVLAGVAINAGAPAFVLPVQTATVTLQPTLNGNPFPASAGEQGDLLLRAVGSATDLFPVGPTNAAMPALRVVRGAYDVVYRHVTGSTVPANANAVVMTNVAVQANVAVPVAVSTVTVTGSFRLNGGPFPASVFDTATIRLSGTTAGDEFPLGRTHLGGTPVPVVPGPYAVVYDADAATVNVPLNRGHVLANGVLLLAPQTLEVDVTGRAVSVQLRLDGASFPVSAATAANVSLEDPATKRRFLLMDSSAGSTKSAMLIPGPYGAVYDAQAEPTAVPSNHGAPVGAVTVP